jgi:hypothetical protein
MTSQDFVDSILTAIIEAFEPLLSAFQSDPPDLTNLLGDLGWGSLTQQQRNSIATHLKSIVDLIKSAKDAAKLNVEVVVQLIRTVDSLSEISNDGSELKTFWESFPTDLLNYLLYTYLEKKSPPIFGVLSFLGVLTEVPRDKIDTPNTNGAVTREAYMQKKVDWAILLEIISQPQNLLNKVYNWTDDPSVGTVFNHSLFVSNVSKLFKALPMSVGLTKPSSTFMDLYYNPDSPSRREIKQLVVTPYQVSDKTGKPEVAVKLLLVIMPIPPESDRSLPPKGFVLFPLIVGKANTDFQISNNLNLELRGGFEGLPIIAEIYPSTVNVKTPPDLSSNISATAKLTLSNTQPRILLGTKDSSRIELSKAHFSLSIRGPDEDGRFDYGFEAGIDDAAVFIDFGEGDGFLSKIFGGHSQKITFGSPQNPLCIRWSPKSGLELAGKVSAMLEIPVDLSILLVKLNTLYLGFQTSDEGLDFLACITGSARIGPVSVVLEKIGLKLSLMYKSNRQPPGILGDLDLSFGFKPPTSIGLSVDAGPVVGGGFLGFDSANERYSGILQLKFGDIGLTAIGLITTRMPDGSKGFSMLLIITAEFNPPIQLSFGFTLSAVGGLVGVHRSMVVDVLRQGIKNRTLDSIMFPQDPILNANRIISDLRAIFPPTENQFILGPMAILGWGTPSLITAELGILIELPNPVRIAILGQIAVELPEKEAAIVELHLDVLGILDFEKRSFSLDATLYDSRILAFTLSGDMAMRLNWGDQPNFALSVGGLNPRFTPPPNFPSLARLMLSLGSGNNPRINLSCYMAITSNSTQFGARLEVYAAAGCFSIQGYMGFDALFIFSPFSFVVDIGAGVAVRAGSTTIMSITLDLMLSGPTPWRVKGKATFKILFIKIKIPVKAKWGPEATDLPPPADPTPLLAAALQDSGNWAGVLPPETEMAVSLRKIEGATDGPILVYPVGTLEVRQRVLPLNLKITKFGNAPVTGVDIFQVGVGDSLDSKPVKEYFARYQFEEGSDQDKLSRPSFEKLDAGIAIGSDEISFKFPVPCKLEYETEVIDENGVATGLGLQPLQLRLEKAFIAGSAANNNLTGKTGFRKFNVRGKAAKVGMCEEGYAIVGLSDLKIKGGIPNNDGALTHAEASRKLEAYIDSHPNEKGELQIVPQYEVAT